MHTANGIPVWDWLYLFSGFEGNKSTWIAKTRKKTTNQKTKKTPPPQTKKKKERTGKENDMLLTKYRLGIYENYSLMPQPKLSVMVPHYTDFSSWQKPLLIILVCINLNTTEIPHADTF